MHMQTLKVRGQSDQKLEWKRPDTTDCATWLAIMVGKCKPTGVRCYISPRLVHAASDAVNDCDNYTPGLVGSSAQRRPSETRLRLRLDALIKSLIDHVGVHRRLERLSDVSYTFFDVQKNDLHTGRRRMAA